LKLVIIKEHELVSGMSDNVDEKLSAFVQEVGQELAEDSPSGMRGCIIKLQIHLNFREINRIFFNFQNQKKTLKRLHRRRKKYKNLNQKRGRRTNVSQYHLP